LTVALPLPADVDLSGMEHMPLFDERLVKSRAWRRARNWRGEGPGLGFVQINLWARTFRNVPAGSIEDDEDELAEAAGCDIAYWRAVKDAALQGWQLIDGRWHHPVVSEISLRLWLTRLDVRHENVVRSWRMNCKRKTDAGVEPPDPPGEKLEWMSRAYPATFAYLRVNDLVSGAPVCDGNIASVTTACDCNKPDCACNSGPKRRKGKETTPPIVPPAAAAAAGVGLETGTRQAGSKGKTWFRAELNRLMLNFGPLAREALTYLQKPGPKGHRGHFGLVSTFKGAWFEAATTTIVMPSKRRADAVVAEHHEWLRHVCPTIKVRHATVDELRAFREANPG
jgi:hypothetical protein